MTPSSPQDRARGTLSEFSRAKARVALFVAIENHCTFVLRDLQSNSAEDWARRWFSGQRWAIRQAIATKEVWADSPKARSRLRFEVFPKGLMAGIRHRRSGKFEYLSWNPLREGKSEARRRLQAELLKHLDAEMDAYAEEIGWSAKSPRRNLERNANWFAIYQFTEKTCGEIALEEDRGKSKREMTANTVQKAVENFAELVGLPLRKGNRPGRPSEAQ
jgi:hypothetical protein